LLLRAQDRIEQGEPRIVVETKIDAWIIERHLKPRVLS